MLHSYLSFNGNCREAMLFYQQCFGGKLSFQTLGESALGKKFPPEMKQLILHANLSHQHFVVMASDIALENNTAMAGNGIIVMKCSNAAQLNLMLTKLQPGSRHFFRNKKIRAGGIAANFQDKFGTQWLLTLST